MQQKAPGLGTARSQGSGRSSGLSQAIKHKVILLPAATEHVTIWLCLFLRALSKYDRRWHLFLGVSALITEKL